MFGWFSPRCPVDLAAKQWIEQRLGWLAGQFGCDVFTRRAVILPTEDFFPDPFDGTEESIRVLLDQVCGYMDVDPDRVVLKLMNNHKPDFWIVNEQGKYLPTGPGGLYEDDGDHTIIHIDTAEMNDLSGMVGTMAHELSHLRLMAEGRVSGHQWDNELLTDLTATFFGFGIFRANSPRNWDSLNTTWPGTTLRRPEYMTAPMYVYAMAHSAWHRDERRPEWARHLSFNLRPDFKEAVCFLFKMGDSQFAPKPKP